MRDKLKVSLSVISVTKAYKQSGKPHVVLDKFSMEIYEGEFLSIFGPNGCGKSTLLHLIAGIIEPDDGRIEIDSVGLKPNVGFVFQNYERSLMPWLTCLDNIAFPLEAETDLSKRDRHEIARAIVKELGLRLPVEHYPYQMSGGQKQLTCIARAMIRRPSILLLDEPFASLDYQTRLEMQMKLQDIWQKTQVTTVFISHEIDEAIYLADRVLLLSERPAHIAGCFNVPLERPRGLDSLVSSTFVNLRAEIIDKFTVEIAK
jgi:NitT/TauT family transport system ATP-binding protein